MKHFFILLLGISISIVLSFYFLLQFGFGNISDYIVGKSIPRYPNVSSWKVSATNGFPDGSPSGNITYKTNDTAKSVFTYYKQALPLLGWQLAQDVPSKRPGQAGYYQQIAFKKSITRPTCSLSMAERYNLKKKSIVRSVKETVNWRKWHYIPRGNTYPLIGSKSIGREPTRLVSLSSNTATSSSAIVNTSTKTFS